MAGSIGEDAVQALRCLLALAQRWMLINAMCGGGNASKRVILVRVACHPFFNTNPDAHIQMYSCCQIFCVWRYCRTGATAQCHARTRVSGWWLLNELAAFVTHQRSLTCHQRSGSVGSVMFFKRKICFCAQTVLKTSPMIHSRTLQRTRLQLFFLFPASYLSQFSAFLRFMSWYIQFRWALDCWKKKIDLLTALI